MDSEVRGLYISMIKYKCSVIKQAYNPDSWLGLRVGNENIYYIRIQMEKFRRTYLLGEINTEL